MAHGGWAIRGGAAALVMLGVAACGDGPTPPDRPVATVEVSPDTATRQVGVTLQLTVTLRDSAGAALIGRLVTWSTSAVGVATVDQSGLVTAGTPGTATITASSEGQDGTAAVTVWRPEVLVGAGDIAECGSIGAPATALLLDTIPGTVFTAGDNAYPSGSDDDAGSSRSGPAAPASTPSAPRCPTASRAAPRAASSSSLCGMAAYDWKFVPIAGESFTDGGTGACHGPP